jgi:hypothetical protein
MSQHTNFPNYYKLFGIPITATPAEVRNGHVQAAARDSSMSHQKLCNEALAVLENREIREEYDKELRDWNKEQLEIGTTRTNTAIRTNQELTAAMESADKSLEDADELIFLNKFANQAQLKSVRHNIHRLCRAAVGDAARVRKWSKMVLDSCEEADRHVAEVQYLMKAQAKNLDVQIRKVEREAQHADKHALRIVEKARDCESEVEKLIISAPMPVNPATKIPGKVKDGLSWLSSVLELTLKIVKYSIFLGIFLLIVWLILYFNFFRS